MDIILYFFRDNIVGTHYFIYAFILLYLMFAIIGYLLKGRYARYNIMLAGGQEEAMKRKKEKEETAKKEALRSGNVKAESVQSKVNTILDNRNADEKAVKEVNKHSQSVKQEPVQNKTVETHKPKPMPNTEVKQTASPKTTPNTKDNDVKPTPASNTSSEPNLSGSIPEL